VENFLSKPYWQDRRVFVSGCNGFLGSWLSKRLVAAGADVVGLIRDRRHSSLLEHFGTDDDITVVDGAITDYELLERILAEYEIDTVFHLAAQTIVGIANRAPLSTFESNIKGTWVTLEAARRNPTVSAVVVASSYHAYGDQTHIPYHENAPMSGRHPYDVSKSCTDMLARSYACTYNLPVVVTRCANLYGGGDLNWNRLVPGTIRSVLRRERPIIRSDGTFRRDYLYVEDAVDAYLTVGERAQNPEVLGQAFNFGLDEGKTVLEVVQNIVDLSGEDNLEPIILNEAKNEIPDQHLASDKARRVLGWQPKHGLEVGLGKSMAWYRDFLQPG